MGNKTTTRMRVHKSVLKGISKTQHDYLTNLMRQARRLLNEAIYINGLTYAERGYYPNYNSAYEQISQLDEYKQLPTDIAQATLRNLYTNYTTTYQQWRNGNKQARTPKQQHSLKPATIMFTKRDNTIQQKVSILLVPSKQNKKAPGETKQEAKARNKRYKHEKQLRSLPLPNDLTQEELENITEIKLVPKNNGEQIELQLTIKEQTTANAAPTIDKATRIITIDPGLDNLMTCTAFETKEGEEAVLDTRIWDGRDLKSRNEWFNRRISDINKEIAELQKKRPNRWRRRVNRHYDALRRAYTRRDRMIDWLAHSYASRLVQWAGSLGVEFVAFSWNDGFKLSLDMGRDLNRRFSQVPLARVRNAVRVACGKAGIGFGVFEESYTSQASALAVDSLPVYGELSEEGREALRFSGFRCARGLYVVVLDGRRFELNADVNANLNQLEKCKPGSRQALVGRLGCAGLLAAVSRPKRERLLNEGYARTGRSRKTAHKQTAAPQAKNPQSAGITLKQKPLLQERPQTL